MKKRVVILSLLAILTIFAVLFFTRVNNANQTVLDGTILNIEKTDDRCSFILLATTNPEIERVELAVTTKNYLEFAKELKINTSVVITFEGELAVNTVSPVTINATILSVASKN